MKGVNMKESVFEKKVVKYLKDKGCKVYKMSGAGVEIATPDRLFLKEGFWGFLEVKKSKAAKYRPLQKEKIAFLNNWSYAKAVYPENFEDIKKELDDML
jgi:Holliday junction resolvase